MPNVMSILSRAAIIALMVVSTPSVVSNVDARGAVLPELPYEYDALEPMLSEEAIQRMHGVHRMHVVNVNKILHDGRHDDYQSFSIEDIIVHTYRNDPRLFNNAAQSWNMSFFWKSICPHKPTDEREPDSRGVLGGFIRRDFGSFEIFHEELDIAANAVFGSGWVWLVYDGNTGKLSVTTTTGAGNPMTTPGLLIPILALSVWEHAYYLDYSHKSHYVTTLLDRLINWEFAEQNLETAVMASHAASMVHTDL